MGTSPAGIRAHGGSRGTPRTRSLVPTFPGFTPPRMWQRVFPSGDWRRPDGRDVLRPKAGAYGATVADFSRTSLSTPSMRMDRWWDLQKSRGTLPSDGGQPSYLSKR